MNIYCPGMCTSHELFQYMNTYCTWNLWVNVHVHEHNYVLEIWLLLNFDQIDRFIASVRNLDVWSLRCFGAFQPRRKFGFSTLKIWGWLSDLLLWTVNFPGKKWSHCSNWLIFDDRCPLLAGVCDTGISRILPLFSMPFLWPTLNTYQSSIFFGQR